GLLWGMGGAAEGLFALQWLALDGDDQIAADTDPIVAYNHHPIRTADTGKIGGGSTLDALHEQAARRRQLERFGQFAREIWCVQSKRGRPRDVAALGVFVEHILGATDRQREPEADIALLGIDGRVDANHVAMGVEQRSTAVAGVDGGVRLDHAFHLLFVFRFDRPVERAYHASCERAAEHAEWITD